MIHIAAKIVELMQTSIAISYLARLRNSYCPATKHSLSADSLVSVSSVEVVNPSISGDSPVSVSSIFEKPIGSTTNLLSEEFLSVFAARSTKPDIDPDSVPAPEIGGAFADTELNAYVEDLPSIRDILFLLILIPIFIRLRLKNLYYQALSDRGAFLPWLRRVTFVPIQLMRMLSLIPGLAESSFPCLWFTPRLSDNIRVWCP